MILKTAYSFSSFHMTLHRDLHFQTGDEQLIRVLAQICLFKLQQ